MCPWSPATAKGPWSQQVEECVQAKAYPLDYTCMGIYLYQCWKFGTLLPVGSIFCWDFSNFFESFKCFFKDIFEYLVRGLACNRWSPFRPCGQDEMTKVGSKWFPVLWEVSFDLLAVGYQINAFVLEKLFSIHFIVPLCHRNMISLRTKFPARSTSESHNSKGCLEEGLQVMWRTMDILTTIGFVKSSKWHKG